MTRPGLRQSLGPRAASRSWTFATKLAGALLELAAVLGRAGYHTPGAVPAALRARALDALCELSLLSAALPGGPKVSATDLTRSLSLP